MTGFTDIFLQLNSVSYSYSERLLLDGISFNLAMGEILCLLGQSGSGKTTLLRLIAGLESTDIGTISFCGEDMEGIPPHKRNFGMMFQEFALFPHKNVEENISFGLEMKKASRHEIKRQIAKMLQLVDLSGFEKRRVDELSGGEQQRVALARSLAPEPKLLLLDEPLGSLDRGLRDRLATDIRKILKTLNLTAIFVTHDQAEAFNIADKIGVLQKGRLVQLDVPETLYKYPQSTSIAQFLGFINLVPGRVSFHSNLFHCPLGDFSFDNKKCMASLDNLSANSPMLLIRPEGASLAEDTSSPQENRRTFKGVVSGKYYLGGRYKISMDIAGTILTFELPLDPTPPEVGCPIIVSIPTTSFVFVAQ